MFLYIGSLILAFSCGISLAMEDQDAANVLDKIYSIDYETEDDFKKRLLQQKEDMLNGKESISHFEKSVITPDNKQVYISRWGSLKVKHSNNNINHLLKLAGDMNFLEKWMWSLLIAAGRVKPFDLKEYIHGLKASANKKFILAFASSGSEMSRFNTDHLLTKLYLLETKTLHVDEVSIASLPRQCPEKDTQDPLIWFNNFFDNGAVSCDGTKIALSNMATVYLAKKKNDGNWEDFSLLKNLKEVARTDKVWLPDAIIRKIDFNKPGNVIGVYSWGTTEDPEYGRKATHYTDLLTVE